MPLFVKSLAFWKAAAYVVAALVAYFFPTYQLTDVMVLALVLSVLQLMGVTPELRARGLM
jgi:di/tricarboxylate transporter